MSDSSKDSSRRLSHDSACDPTSDEVLSHDLACDPPTSDDLMSDLLHGSTDRNSPFYEAIDDQRIQTMPTTSLTTPIIQIATPIHETTPYCNYTHFNSLDTILSRRISVDPKLNLPSLKRRLYGCPSMVQRLALETSLKGHEGCVNSINFSWGGRLLASGSDDLHVILWDWAAGRSVAKFDSGHVANVFQAKFMPYSNDSIIVTAARDGQIMCDTISTTGTLLHSKRVGSHNDSAHKLSIEPGSPYVFLSCGEDGTVLQVDLREDNTKDKILVCRNEKNKRISLYSVFIDPSDTNYFAVSGRDQWARIYDRRHLREERAGRYEPVKRYCPHHLMRPENESKRANITCLVYSHDGKELLCSYNDEDIYIFDTSHSSEADRVHRYSGHRNSATVKGVNFFGLESEYIVSGSDCGNVFLWDKHSENIVQYMEGDCEGVVNCLEPHPHIPILATSGLDHDVKIFSPSSSRRTTLDGLTEVMDRNKTNREAAWNSSPSDGYEAIMDFIMRRYRRGLRERVRLQDEDLSDDSSSPPNGEEEQEDDNEEEEEEEDEEGRGREQLRCVQQ